MMNILHFSQSVKWSSWFICSLLLHGLIFLAFIWRFSEVQPAMSPAPAIMLQWAEIIEAPSSPLSLPVGIAPLFVSYSNMLKTAEGMKPLHKLLMLDGTTLALKGEVKDAYKGTAYGLTMDEKTQKIYVGGRDYINEIDAKNQTLLRTIPLKDPRPQITSVQNLAVDSASDRAFVVVFDHDDRSGTKDGLYIFDLRDGKQLGYVHTGAGANAVKYNPKYNELYVTNFTSGTISVVDATKYSITREFNMPVYPNQMVLSDDMDTLYIGIKEGFNRDWDPDVFVEGAKERILSIDLKKS
jgi:hypothetical protein